MNREEYRRYLGHSRPAKPRQGNPFQQTGRYRSSAAVICTVQPLWPDVDIKINE